MHQLIVGNAGSGKTTQAVRTAVKSGKPIIIIRSMVETGRSMGFLPGDIDEKTAPWFDMYKEFFDDIEKGLFGKLRRQNNIRFMPTTHLRGRTFVEHEIILDEFQNLTFHELSTIVTRVGLGTRLIVCGDLNQSDLPPSQRSGAKKFVEIFKSLPHVKHHHLTSNFRAGIVADYLKAVAEYDEQEQEEQAEIMKPDQIPEFLKTG